MTTLGLAPDTPKGFPNCGVVALSVITGTPYKEVEKYWKVRRRGNWKGRTHRFEILQWLHKHGYEYTKKKVIGGTLRNRVLDGTFEKGVTYLVETTGHYQVVKDGVVVDQGNDNAVPISKFWGKQKQVKAVYTIENVGDVARW